MIMPKRSKASSDDQTPKARAVTAVFNPVGMVKVNVVTPEGNTYEVKPREPFKIAAEDVEWFFGSWDWAFRQRLCRIEDYKPVCGYQDNTVAGKKQPVVLVQQDSSTFKPEPGAVPGPAEGTDPEPEAKQEPEPDEGAYPEPDEGQEDA